MADFTLGGVPILSGNVNLPRIGAWTMDAYLQTTIAPLRGTTTTLALKDRLMLGTVVASSADYLQVKCRVVGGRGKLNNILSPRDYRGYQASEIAQDALRDAGEVPGQWSALDVYCAHWTRSQGPCRGTLRRLARLWQNDDVVVGEDEVIAAGATVPPVWRVLDDGTVDSVVDDFSTTASQYVPLESWGQDRLVQLSVDDALLSPGRSVVAFGATRRLDRVVYGLEPRSFQALCWYY